MCFDGDNESINAEFIWNNNPVKRMLISIQKCNMKMFSRLQL